MKRYYTSILLMSLAQISNAQTPPFDWASQVEATGSVVRKVIKK